MLLITCPHCGDRDENEFVYGGRAIKYPGLDKSVSIRIWHEILHLRDNPRGVIREFWYHQYGCECWFELSGDTLTHEISALPGIEV